MSIIRHQGDECDRFNEELEQLVSGGFDSISRKINSNYPQVDIIEESHFFHLIADLPGLDRSDFEIIVSDNVLTITGEKKQSRLSGKNHYCHFERNFGKFNRSFNLPSNINNNSINAYYKDGVLDIVILKNKNMPTNAIIIDNE